MSEEEKNAKEHHHHQAASSAPDDTQSPQQTATEKAFEDYKTGLTKTDIPNGYTLLKNSIINNRSQRATRRNKRCFLVKAEDTGAFYQTMSNNITVFAKQDAEEIRDNVTDYIAQNTDLAAKMTDALKAIKAAKDKILIAKDKAYKMDEARKNSALSDAVAEMEKIYPGKKGTFGSAVEELKNDAEHNLNLADDAMEVAIKVTGIRAGANIENLKAISVELADKTAGISTDAATNLTDARKLQADAQAEYDEALKTLSKTKYDKYEKTLGYEATLDTTSQVHDLDCARWDKKKIKDELDKIAREVEGNFVEEE